MSSICLIDTSIFLNLLDVPGRNNEKAEVTSSFQAFVELETTFILPMATIIETGNHIAQNGNGTARRHTAERFCEVVAASFDGTAPFRPSEFPNTAEISGWLKEFPNHAGRNKSPEKINEGTSFGDLSIIKDFEKCQERFYMSEVFIWSLDGDLNQYRHMP